MLAMKTAATRNVDGGTQCLTDEMPSLAMVGCIPVGGLVFELQHRRPPTDAFGRLQPVIRSKPCHLRRPPVHNQRGTVRGRPPPGQVPSSKASVRRAPPSSVE